MRSVTPLLVALLLPWPATAQQSTSFEVSDHVLNAGGHPAAGTVLSSTSFRITLDAVGDSIVGPELGSLSFGMQASFASCYPPPGEVLRLGFGNEHTLSWNAERSVGYYNLYRGLLSSLTGLGYGTCKQQELSTNTAADPDLPPGQNGYFYLVTAANRLDEEGTKGFHSDATERQGAVCP